MRSLREPFPRQTRGEMPFRGPKLPNAPERPPPAERLPPQAKSLGPIFANCRSKPKPIPGYPLERRNPLRGRQARGKSKRRLRNQNPVGLSARFEILPLAGRGKTPVSNSLQSCSGNPCAPPGSLDLNGTLFGNPGPVNLPTQDPSGENAPAKHDLKPAPSDAILISLVPNCELDLKPDFLRQGLAI